MASLVVLAATMLCLGQATPAASRESCVNSRSHNSADTGVICEEEETSLLSRKPASAQYPSDSLQPFPATAPQLDALQGDQYIVAQVDSSMKLSQTFMDLAAQLPEGSTKELFDRLKVCTSCSSYQRLGEAHDGGYLTCVDGLQGSQLRAAFSMGVNDHDKWSYDIYNLTHAPIHQFDCTVAGPAQNCADCHFHKACLQSANRTGGHPLGPNMNMQEALASTGQADAPNASLIMKMDIEGAEWPIFAVGSNDLRKFKQLIIEFHRLGQEDSHSQYATALRNIENGGFKVSHIHGNNYGGMYYKAGLSVPQVIEVTFIKNSPALPTCESTQSLHPLDRANNAGQPELPMAKLS